MIPYGRQEITQADINAVIDVLQSDFLTQGPAVTRFEQMVAQYCGASYAVAVNSATSALHIACLALGLGEGDWLWTSPITFVASANCGLYCGAKVDFVDIDPITYNLSPCALEAKLIQADIEGRLPKIVVPVHLCGQSCEMEAIYKLSQKYGFKIIEDASHAIGARYQGESIGSGKYSDITVFSFHPVKIITTGEGGMAVTNNHQLAETIELLRSHGITRDLSRMTGMADGCWYYQQIDLGFNYRMTDIQAALGISQIQRLDKFITKRHVLKERYDCLLSDLPLIKPYQHADSFSSFHLYPIRVDLASVEKSRKQVFDELRSENIGVNIHYIPVYLQPYYKNFGFKEGYCPVSESYYENVISVPLFHSMSFAQQDSVVSALKNILLG